MPAKPLLYSEQMKRTPHSPISYLIKLAFETPGMISFAAGLVDDTHFPVKEIADASAELFGDPVSARSALQYGTTQGLPKLRQQVLKHHCQADGIEPSSANLSANDVVITNGSQQSLYLLSEALLDPGDIVICEAPSYFVYHGVLHTRGARAVSVPIDAHGMKMDALDATLARLEKAGELPRVKIIYTVDYFQNPTGVSLAADRRPKMVEIAKKYSKDHRIIVVEDAAYRELRYSVPDVPSVKKYDPTNEYVVFTSTFSKPCSPGLKTGYAICPSELTQSICHLKGNHDFGTSNLAQNILANMLESGSYQNHVLVLREIYQKKAAAMIKALNAEFSDLPGVHWENPEGGMYVWLTLPPHMDSGLNGKVFQNCLKEKVIYVPGEYCHVPDENGKMEHTSCRLSFGISTDEQIAEGIKRLRRACS